MIKNKWNVLPIAVTAAAYDNFCSNNCKLQLAAAVQKSTADQNHGNRLLCFYFAVTGRFICKLADNISEID